LICRVIKQREWCQETENELYSLEIKFSADTVLSVLQIVGENPETALEFFKWVGRQTCFKHSASTYNAMIKLVGSNKYIDLFWILINEMGHEGYHMDLKTYITVLRRFLKRKMMKDAVDLFIWMMANGESKPSSQNCSTVLHELSLFSSPDIDLVFKVVETFLDGGGYLDKAIYDGIHRSLSSSGRFDEAEDVVNAMRKAGFVPDNITYSQLVYGLCKAGRLDEGCTILEKMEGLGCTPDLKTWTILIDGHCRAGEVDKALSCFRQMVENGCQADCEVLAILVNAFCNQNRVEIAYSFLCQMIEEKSAKPSQATFKVLLKKLTHAGKLPEALKVLDLMKDEGFPPFVDPFYEIYAKSETVDRALDFLDKMRRKRVAPVKAYFSMLDAFCKAGKEIEAQDLLHKCPHHIRSNAEILSLFGSMSTPNPA
jgi:pentatricopeptide repeat protein